MKDETVEIVIRFESPKGVTEDQIKEWIAFSTGYTGSMAVSNPMSNFEFNEVADMEDFQIKVSVR